MNKAVRLINTEERVNTDQDCVGLNQQSYLPGSQQEGY
jgi:hypothetical protein